MIPLSEAHEMVKDLLAGVLARNPHDQHEALTEPMAHHDYTVATGVLTEMVIVLDQRGLGHHAPSVVLDTWEAVVTQTRTQQRLNREKIAELRKYYGNHSTADQMGGGRWETSGDGVTPGGERPATD